MSVKKKKKKIKLTETAVGASQTSGDEGETDMSSQGGHTVSKKENPKPKADDKPKADRHAKGMDKPKDSESKKDNKEKESKGSFGQQIKGTVTFLKEVDREARKITWPPRSQVMQETWSVIVLVAFITVLVLGYDYVLGHWVFGPLEHLSKMNAPAQPAVTLPINPSEPVDKSGLPGSPLSNPNEPVNPLSMPVPTPESTTTPLAPGTTPAAPGTTPAVPVTPPGAPGATTPVVPAPTNPAVPSGTTPAPTTSTTPAPTTTPAVPAPAGQAPSSTPAPAKPNP